MVALFVGVGRIMKVIDYCSKNTTKSVESVVVAKRDDRVKEKVRITRSFYSTCFITKKELRLNILYITCLSFRRLLKYSFHQQRKVLAAVPYK